MERTQTAGCFTHTVQTLGHAYSCSESGACAPKRCSPPAAPFPPHPPQEIAFPCSGSSQVLRHSPTSPARARPSYGFGPSRTGLLACNAAAVLPSSYSPGSRHPDLAVFRSSITRPTDTSDLRFATHLAMCHARLEVRMDSLLPFLQGLAPLQHVGLSRRTACDRQFGSKPKIGLVPNGPPHAQRPVYECLPVISRRVLLISQRGLSSQTSALHAMERAVNLLAVSADKPAERRRANLRMQTDSDGEFQGAIELELCQERHRTTAHHRKLAI